MNVAIYVIGVVVAVTNSGSAGGGVEIFLTSQYAIPIFLVMVFAAAVFSSRTKIHHVIVLVGFGIAVSFLDFAGLSIVDIKQFKIDKSMSYCCR